MISSYVPAGDLSLALISSFDLILNNTEEMLLLCSCVVFREKNYRKPPPFLAAFVVQTIAKILCGLSSSESHSKAHKSTSTLLKG